MPLLDRAIFLTAGKDYLPAVKNKHYLTRLFETEARDSEFFRTARGRRITSSISRMEEHSGLRKDAAGEVVLLKLNRIA
jgi:hypothetical protein